MPTGGVCVYMFAAASIRVRRDSDIPIRNYYAKHHIQNMNGEELAIAFLYVCQRELNFVCIRDDGIPTYRSKMKSMIIIEEEEKKGIRAMLFCNHKEIVKTHRMEYNSNVVGLFDTGTR